MVSEKKYFKFLLLGNLRVFKLFVSYRQYIKKADVTIKTFCLEDDDRRIVDFNGKKLSCTFLFLESKIEMSYQRYETSFYCADGRHQSATISIESHVAETGQKTDFL